MRSPTDHDSLKWLLRLRSYLLLNTILLAGGLVAVLSATGWKQNVGSALVASAGVGFLFAYQLKIDRQFDHARQVYDHYGLIDVTPLRSHRDIYIGDFRRCRRKFEIIGESLSRFYDDLGREFLPQLNARDVKIRILLLDPDSEFVSLREAEDSSPERTDLRREIIKATECYQGLNLNNVEIRYYSCTPTLSYQRIDNRVYAGPYFVGISSGQQPALLLRANEHLASAYQEHFECIWNEYSREVTPPLNASDDRGNTDRIGITTSKSSPSS